MGSNATESWAVTLETKLKKKQVLKKYLVFLADLLTFKS